MAETTHRIRGISEKIKYIHNPMPVVTEMELLEIAELDMFEASKADPFDVLWNYGGLAAGCERIHLPPQCFHALRSSEVGEFMTEFKEVGMCVVDDPHDEAEVIKHALTGLRAGLKFYSHIGRKGLARIRKTHAYSKEDMEDLKADHWVYYVNEAKAIVIKREIDRLLEQQKASR